MTEVNCCLALSLFGSGCAGLGFRGLVRELTGDVSRAAVLRTLLSKIHSPTNQATKSGHIDFRAQSISDAVAISTFTAMEGLLILFQAIEHLAVELLKEGYFIRGALVKGKLYHDEHMVFGEPLIRAYELERTVVRFPRVMVFREIMQDIDKYCSGGFFKARRSDFEKHLEQADDGPYYIHVLRTVSADIAKLQLENLNLPSEKKHSLDEYAKMQALIQKRLNEATDNRRHFEKAVVRAILAAMRGIWCTNVHTHYWPWHGHRYVAHWLPRIRPALSVALARKPI